MRIVFFGTPDFATVSLERLVSSAEVVSVVTQPDRPRGRGRHRAPSPVKILASQKGIPVLEPDSPKDPAFVRGIGELKPELLCVVAYGHILRRELLDIPPLGSIGVHPSLLPKYRGAAPINWALIRGEKVTGLSTYFMDEAMDAGEIILQKEVAIGEDETAGELSERLSVIGADLLVETLDLIRRGDPPRIRQDGSQATLAPKIKKEDCLIRWDRPASEVRDLIRGLSPRPGAHTFFRGGRLRVLRASAGPGGSTACEAGEVVETGKGFAIACGQGVLLPEVIQPEGKREMDVSGFVAGYGPKSGERLG